MPSSALWWTPRRLLQPRPGSGRGNALLLSDEEVAATSPRTPERDDDAHTPAASSLPLPLRVRALAAAFRAANAGLGVAGLAAVGAALLLDAHSTTNPTSLAPTVLALAAAGVGSAALGAATGCSARSALSPRALATYSAALGGAVLAEVVLGMAWLAWWRGGGAPGPPPGPQPGPTPPPPPSLDARTAALAAAGALLALQVIALAVATVLEPAMSAAEDWRAEAASAAEGWASPERWGAPTGGRAARPAAPATTITTPPPAADPDGAAWSTRMRDRYGLDTAAMAYDPAARAAASAGRGRSGRVVERGGGVGGGRTGVGGGTADDERVGEAGDRRCAVM